MNSLEITKVLEGEKAPTELLLLADPDEVIVRSYLKSGLCFKATLSGKTVGAFVLNELNNNEIEIMNIAVDPDYQQRGIGRTMLNFSIEYASGQGYSSIYIATGNSSIHQLGLYQKIGFEMDHIVQNYFVDHYKEKIVENGIWCKHKVVLKKVLTK